MKQIRLLNRTLILLLLALIVLHIASLFEVIPAYLFWDELTPDYVTMFYSEIIILSILISFFCFYILYYKNFKRYKARKNLERIQRGLFIFFILEFLGSLFGKNFQFKAFGCSLYLTLIIVLILTILNESKLNKRIRLQL